MRLKLDDITIYAKDFTIETSASEDMEISIGEGYVYIDTNWISKECAKAEREKVWEMAKAINLAKEDGGMRYVELEDCFGTKNIQRIMKSYSVDEALEKYEAWKKINSSSAEEEIKAWWEMAGHILRMPSAERLKYFGISQALDIFSMPVDQALDMYESWKKANSVEELIKSLKPQDVIAVPKPYGCGDYSVYMITMVNPYAEDTCVIRGIEHTGDVILNRRKPEEYKGLEKIGRVVETTDILGEIKKIEDEWRKIS